MKEMTDYEFEKKMADEEYKDKMEAVKKHLERINHGKPVTFSPSVNPSNPEELFCDDEHGDLHITSPGCRGIPKSGFPKPPTVDDARAMVEEMLDWAGAMSFMPEFDDLFDQIEKITRRKSKKCTKKI